MERITIFYIKKNPCRTLVGLVAGNLVGPLSRTPCRTLVAGLVAFPVFLRDVCGENLCRRPCRGLVGGLVAPLSRTRLCSVAVLRDVCGENPCRGLVAARFAGFALSHPCRGIILDRFFKI